MIKEYINYLQQEIVRHNHGWDTDSDRETATEGVGVHIQGKQEASWAERYGLWGTKDPDSNPGSVAYWMNGSR